MASRDGTTTRGTYRFVHASDLHLDAPARAAGPLPEPFRTALRDASLRAWKRLVDLAVQRDAAFVVLSGGLFDGPRATLRSCALLSEGVRRLRAHRIDVFIARTPDDLAAMPRLALFVEGATLLDADAPTNHVVRDGRCLATIHTAAAAEAAPLQPAPAAVRIGVVPADAPPGEARGRVAVDYWALGGAAEHAISHERPWLVWPGTLQGRGLEPPQLGPKGCVLVEVEDGCVGSAALLPLDAVRFVSLEIDVTGWRDSAAPRNRLLDAISERVAGDRTQVAEAVLLGQSAGHFDDRGAEATELLSALRRDSAARGWRVWWARVRDRTEGCVRQKRASARHLHRIVVDRAEALAAPLPRGRFLAATFAPLLRRRETETDLAAQAELVHEAAALAVDLTDAYADP